MRTAAYKLGRGKCSLKCCKVWGHLAGAVRRTHNSWFWVQAICWVLRSLKNKLKNEKNTKYCKVFSLFWKWVTVPISTGF